MSVSTWRASASSAIISAFNLFFNRSFQDSVPGAPGIIPAQRLPADIWVDEIFPYLLIEELLRFRKTCKPFYLLTHEPIIWKRYLQRLKIPIAQLRPTFKYNERVSNYEIETMVTSACAIDRAWRGGFPKIRLERVLTSQCKVVDLRLLPGGKFLVASIKDRCNFRFFILVYALDVMHGSRMLARMPTMYKAYDLQAKYMTYDGNPGIMIYYTRRRFKNGVPRDVRENINEYDHRVRFPTKHAMIYEGICVHMRLDAVEHLIHPDINPSKRRGYTGTARQLPAPFVDVMQYKTESEIHSPSLIRVDGEPMVTLVEDGTAGSSIHIINLHKDHLVQASIICKDFEGFEGMPHRIRAVRYLPCQKGLLVIRSVRESPTSKDNILFEIYDLPKTACVQSMYAPTAWSFPDKWNLSGEFVISDADFVKTSPDHPDINMSMEECPPTVWAFAPSTTPKGCVYVWFKAKKNEHGQYRYTQTDVKPRHHQNERFHERAIAGSERTLFLEVDNENSSTMLSKMRRFFFASSRFEIGDEDGQGIPPADPIDISMPVMERPPELDRALVDILCSEDVGISVNKAGGLVATAWDETSGKICVAAENEDFIRVLDIAPVVEPHLRLAYKWQRSLIDPKPTIHGYQTPIWTL